MMMTDITATTVGVDRTDGQAPMAGAAPGDSMVISAPPLDALFAASGAATP